MVLPALVGLGLAGRQAVAGGRAPIQGDLLGHFIFERNADRLGSLVFHVITGTPSAPHLSTGLQGVVVQVVSLESEVPNLYKVPACVGISLMLEWYDDLADLVW